METNQLLLVAATLVTLPAAIGCDRSSGSANDPVDLKVGALVTTGTANGVGTLSWTLPSYADPLRVPLTALNELKINDRAKTFTASGSAGPVASTGNVQTNIGVDAVVGELNSVAGVWLRERAVVSGNLTTAGTLVTQNGTSVTGTIRQQAAMERGTMALSLQFEPSTVDVQSSELTAPLEPGRYRTITVRGGGITLKGGVYKVDNFIVDWRQG